MNDKGIIDDLKRYISLIEEKIKKIDEDINCAEKNVEEDLAKIVDRKMKGIDEETISTIFKEIDTKQLVDLKKKHLNRAKKELMELRNQIEFKKIFLEKRLV